MPKIRGRKNLCNHLQFCQFRGIQDRSAARFQQCFLEAFVESGKVVVCVSERGFREFLRELPDVFDQHICRFRIRRRRSVAHSQMIHQNPVERRQFRPVVRVEFKRVKGPKTVDHGIQIRCRSPRDDRFKVRVRSRCREDVRKFFQSGLSAFFAEVFFAVSFRRGFFV